MDTSVRKGFRFFLVNTAVTAWLLFVSGCGSAPIMLDSVGGQKEIHLGEKAAFFWNFQNAEYVIVRGDSVKRLPTDQISVTPTQTTTYSIVAYNGSDSLSSEWTVTVLQDTKPTVVSRGAEPAGFTPEPERNGSPSTFLKGYTSIQKNAPTKLKIVQANVPTEQNARLQLRVIPMDENGNYVTGLPVGDAIPDWKLFISCNGKSEEYNPMVSEVAWKNGPSRLQVNLCIDRSSSAALYDQEIRKSLADFPFVLGANDKLSAVAFNQAVTTIVPASSRNELNYFTEKFQNTEPSGLNALYKNVFSALPEQSESYSNVCVIIATSSDNASLIYTAEDVVKKARASKTPCYTIAIGDAVETYALKYIATQTGGKFYYVAPENIKAMVDCFREIVYSNRSHYVAQVPYRFSQMDVCDNVVAKIAYESKGTTLEDKLSLVSSGETTLPPYQALCLFAFRQNFVQAEYKPLLESIATTLKDNPSKVIELIGHASGEGEEDAMRKLAMERAQSVRRALYELGVNPMQIRSRALGDLKPIYYLQSQDWQKSFNRRVEVRWLDPSVQPYEIITDYVYTENDAIKLTEKWESRGYKSYYERVLINSTPAFRIKLWGYSTEESAVAESRLVEKKFNTKVSVE